MSVLQDHVLTILVILILFVIGWILTVWKEDLGHRKASHRHKADATDCA